MIRQLFMILSKIIALGTDGIWEARNMKGNMFGKKRFREIIRRNAKENAINILDAVYDGLDQHTKGLKTDDDITLVVAKVCNNWLCDWILKISEESFYR